MTFAEWTRTYECKGIDALNAARAAWESGIQEGIDRMYRLYDICPECRLPNGQHQMNCGRGR